MAEAKKAIWLSKIGSREDALKLVKDTSNGFFFVAGLLVVISFILDSTLLIDAGVYAIGGFFIRRFNSRSAAVILLVFAAVGAVFTIANMTGAQASGGTNIILALIILGAAVRAVEATFKLHGKFATEAKAGGAPGL